MSDLDEDTENKDSIEFLFDISKVVKHFYETPVILLTMTDFSDTIFNTMCNIRNLIRGKHNINQKALIDHIVQYHLNWLRFVNEIDEYKKTIKNIPRQEIYSAVKYTIEVMGYRLKYYQRYMEKYRPYLPNAEQSNITLDIEIVEDMHNTVIELLNNRLLCFQNFTCDQEFQVIVSDTIDQLLLWLDTMHDGLSVMLTKYVNLNIPHLSGDLTRTLQQIVDEIKTSNDPQSTDFIQEVKQRGKQLSSMIRCTAPRNLEISKVLEKISVLEERIRRLEDEPFSAAIMALKYKRDYLEKRIESLDNLKMHLKSINDLASIQFRENDDEDESEYCVCKDFYQLRIFNHDLPPEERERLVSALSYLWDSAVFGESQKSMISILSAVDVKEEFTDDIGTFYLDEHGRKIYKLHDDTTLYQANEQNKLVPLNDDSGNIYYYDNCGRYYYDPKSKQRVYKAHATASEYMMDSSGILLKVKEERDGITYYYDSFGRYYLDDEGKHIYRDPDSVSEYENDGLGNLVRIRSQLDMLQPCPDDAHVTEDFKYLRHAIGTALRHCIAQVIILQPADPIKHLSALLIKYRENMELKDKRAREKEELHAERDFIKTETRAAAEKAAREAALREQRLYGECGEEGLEQDGLEPSSSASSISMSDI